MVPYVVDAVVAVTVVHNSLVKPGGCDGLGRC